MFKSLFRKILRAWRSPVRYGGGGAGVSLKAAKHRSAAIAAKLDAHWERERAERGPR